MFKKNRAFPLFLLLLAAITGCVTASVQQSPQGEWAPIKITAKGGGAPPATAINAAQARLMTERAAKVDAMRNLLEQAYGVTISSRTTVRDFVTQNDTMRAKVNAYLRGAKVIDTRYLNDGGVEIEMEIILGYEFRGLFP